MNNRSGYYNIIPTESIFSKITTLFREQIQVTGRSCKISDTVNTTVVATGDFLSDIFKFDKFYWIFIGAASGTLVLIILLLCINKHKCGSFGTTTIIQNNTIISPQGEEQDIPRRWLFNSLRRKKKVLNEIKREENPAYYELKEEN